MKKVRLNDFFIKSDIPIGFIVFTVKNESPASLFGGTWECLTNNGAIPKERILPIITSGRDTVVEKAPALHFLTSWGEEIENGDAIALGAENGYGYLTNRVALPSKSFGDYKGNLYPSNLILNLTQSAIPNIYIWKRVA